jgi:hypothetical protein
LNLKISESLLIYILYSFGYESTLLFYLCVMSEKMKPVLDKRISRDDNIDQIDYDAKACIVIERVFEGGDVEDICQYNKYYGDKKGIICQYSIIILIFNALNVIRIDAQ